MTRADLTQEARVWRAVMRRVRWVTLILAFGANIAAVLLGVGWYASEYDKRLELVEGRSKINTERISVVELRQRDADELAARLEERMIGAQQQLGRIESLLQAIARDAHNGVRDPRR